MKQIASILAALILCLCTTAALANQIHPVSGAYYTSEVDLKVAARGVPMVWERTYRSNRTLLKIENPEQKSFEYVAPVDGPLGHGWHSPFTMRIWKNAAIVSDPAYNCDALIDADGRIIYFEKGPGGLVLPDYANGYTLSTTATGNTLAQRGGNTWTFDSAGRLLTIADPLGRTARLIYTGDALTSIADAGNRTIFTLTWTDNHITRITDLSGRTITYDYNSGNLASVNHIDPVTTAHETLVTYSYSSAHGLTVNKNALNETCRINYRFPPSQGMATSITDPAANSTVQSMDSKGTTVTVKDPAGNTRTQTRNEEGQLTCELDNTGAKTITVGYLGGGARILTDADGNITKEYRDLWDNLLKRIDPEGGITQYSYNSNGKPTSIIDAENVTTTISYDTSGSLPASITRAQGSADQTVTSFVYDNGDLQSTATDGSSTSFTYNNAGLPLTITDPEGNVTTLTYDAVGNLTSSTDANSNKTEYSYDWRGNLLTVKDGEGNITSYAYNAAGRLAIVTDSNGNTTSTATDFNGRMTSIAAPSGTTVFSYDGNGNLKSVTRGDATTSHAYDSKNRLTTTTDPEGNTTTYAYPTGGGSCSTCGGGSDNTTPTVITDPLGNITTNTLDKLGRIKQVSDPLNNLTNLSYDRVGRIKTRTDANGNQTVYSYDKLGRIISQTDAEGGVTKFTYDKRGSMLTLSDPENNTTSFEYDKAGRKIKETRPEGQGTSYAYYPNGLLKTVIDAKGQTTTYSYDKANRLTETRFADNTKHSFGYDKAGNMTSYITPDVQATISFDAANRKTGETVTIGAVTKTYSYSYDAKGNKDSFTSPEGVIYGYTYNKNDQPKSITTPAGQITLDYSWVRNTKVILPNGVTTDYSYNDNNWLSNIAAQKSPNTVFNAGYQFDKVGNITSKVNDITTNYGYDKTYQLTTAINPAISEAFSYDKVGNRKTKQGTQTPWTYNRNNELQSAETATLGYDNNGNTTTKTENGQTTTFNYGSTDWLTSVQLPDGKTATYTYDPFGRRIKKQVGSEVTIFIYADEGLIGEYTVDGTNRRTYGWRPNGIWGANPVFMAEGGNYYFYHNDHLGTPQSMTGANGDVVWEATFETFGKATIDPDSSITNNLRFPGQYFDEETGLHYNRFRYYSNKEGRYFASDIAGLAFEFNLYRYAYNNSLKLFDVYGLFGDGIAKGGTVKGHSDFSGSDVFDYTKEDHDPNTRPENLVTGIWRHFRSINDVMPNLLDSITHCNFDGFERYMHQGQDTFSHYNKGYRAYGGNGKLGHISKSYLVKIIKTEKGDISYKIVDHPQNPDLDGKAWLEAEEFSKNMLSIWKKKCGCKKRISFKNYVSE